MCQLVVGVGALVGETGARRRSSSHAMADHFVAVLLKPWMMGLTIASASVKARSGVRVCGVRIQNFFQNLSLIQLTTFSSPLPCCSLIIC